MIRSILKLNKFLKTLTKEEAFHRSNIIRQNSINYCFHVKLNLGESYEGLAEISFQTKQLQFEDRSLFLDFQGKNVKSIFLNGNQIQTTSYESQNGKIYVPKNNLIKNGQNYMVINYTNEYNKDGSGLVSFIDVDSKQYLYTQFQPYMANRVFPVFDQPDLKAKMELILSFEQKWGTVLSNEDCSTEPTYQDIIDVYKSIPVRTEKRIKLLSKYLKDIPQSYKRVGFRPTKLLPTYLYCFVAGPYKKYPLSQTYRNIPMNLYCIDSLYSDMLNLMPLLTEITNQSMKFFQSYFGYQYPFSKYDQIFAHQYKWGAMENAGIVTLNDKYIFRDAVSTQRKFGLANTVVHELAHHWFGNLVTMKWWDDLWLNQSFAQYISHFCLQKIRNEINALKYQSAMTSFYYRKGWGYKEDELQTTHPIRGIVNNTDEAESIFDGITYAKGAGTMKQLMYLVGEDNFSRALKHYFNKFAFSNAVLDDLLDSISKNNKRQLPVTMENWKTMWLQSAGVNQIICQWNPQSIQQLNYITIHQSSYLPNFHTLRVHRIKIAFLYQKHNSTGVQIKQLQTTLLADPSTKIPCHYPPPSAIILNSGDLSFVKTIIDQKSMNFLKNNLKFIQNLPDGLLLSSMIWHNFYEMVTDAKLTINDYVNIAIHNLFDQKSDSLIEQQLNFVYQCIKLYTPQVYRQSYFNQLFKRCKQELIKLISNSQSHQYQNRIVILKSNIIKFAESEDNKKQILQWYQSKHPELNLSKSSYFILTISLQWRSILKVLTIESLTHQKKHNIFNKQCEIDSSDEMVCYRHTFQSLMANHQQLQQIYQQYLNLESKTSATHLAYSMNGFNNKIHRKLIEQQFYEKYFSDFVQMTNRSRSDRIQVFLTALDPIIQGNQKEIQKKIISFNNILCQVKNDKYLRIIKKKIELLKKRKQAYKKYNTQHRL